MEMITINGYEQSKIYGEQIEFIEFANGFGLFRFWSIEMFFVGSSSTKTEQINREDAFAIQSLLEFVFLAPFFHVNWPLMRSHFIS